MIIQIMAKKQFISKKGSEGTLICYSYHDETFEGFPVGRIWIPKRFKKNEDIIVGQLYDMVIHDSYATRLKRIQINS